MTKKWWVWVVNDNAWVEEGGEGGWLVGLVQSGTAGHPLHLVSHDCAAPAQLMSMYIHRQRRLEAIT